MIAKTLVLVTVSVFLRAESLASKPTQPIHRPIPHYLVYRHFLGMVNGLSNKAIQAGATDRYAFAQSFERAGMENADWDLLLSEAAALDSELTQHEQRIQAIAKAYRAEATKAVQSGQALPPVPDEVYRLEALRTASMIHHMVMVQSQLGKDKTARLESYLEREFAPKVSLKVLAHPPASLQAAVQ